MIPTCRLECLVAQAKLNPRRAPITNWVHWLLEDDRFWNLEESFQQVFTFLLVYRCSVRLLAGFALCRPVVQHNFLLFPFDRRNWRTTGRSSRQFSRLFFFDLVGQSRRSRISLKVSLWPDSGRTRR